MDQARTADLPARELAKIVLTIFLAGYQTHRDSLAIVRRKVLESHCPAAVTWDRCWGRGYLALAVMAFETDLGTALIFFGLFVAMVYVATQRRGGSSSVPC